MLAEVDNNSVPLFHCRAEASQVPKSVPDKCNHIAPKKDIIYCRNNLQVVVNVDCTNSTLLRCVVLMSSETQVVTISAIDERQV